LVIEEVEISHLSPPSLCPLSRSPFLCRSLIFQEVDLTSISRQFVPSSPSLALHHLQRSFSHDLKERRVNRVNRTCPFSRLIDARWNKITRFMIMKYDNEKKRIATA